ncbi:hypothetical protein [Streptomyces syringium]|uniref:hypothetical protein n=1 Tax=Streptomyces syringium TaxID=76729 RepID=UPI003AADC5D9
MVGHPLIAAQYGNGALGHSALDADPFLLQLLGPGIEPVRPADQRLRGDERDPRVVVARDQQQNGRDDGRRDAEYDGRGGQQEPAPGQRTTS